MKKLFPHNQAAVDAINAHYAAGNRKAAIVHATGTGKSYIIAAVTEQYPHALIIAPNNFVLDETRKVCHPGCEFRTYASVMYDEGEHGKYDIIVLDEFHRSGAEKWGAGVKHLLDANPQALLLGTSATHIRYLDGQRNMADELFDGQVVSHLPLKEAIDRQILPNPTYVSSIYTMVQTVSARKDRIRKSRKTEEEKQELCRRLDGIAHNWENAGGVPRIIRKYFRKDMQRVIVFCSKVARAAEARQMLSKWFGLAGFNRVRYYNIDYKEKRLETEMEDFQQPLGDYDLKVAISVNMLNEGVHVPHVDGVIMLRSTISRIIIEQQVGRCLTSDNKDSVPVVLDLVNNMDLIRYDEPVKFGEWDGSRSGDNAKHGNGGFSFDVIDECREIRELLQQLDNEIRKEEGFWTKESLIADAQKYPTKKEWREHSASAYVTAKNMGIVDECCAHMIPERVPNGYWTLERCQEAAKPFDSIAEWRDNDPRSYAAAKRAGIIDKCTMHMPEQQHKPGYWTEERCIADARKYTSVTEWVKNSSGAYDAALRLGIKDKCCAHMREVLTLEECIASACKFRNKTEWHKNEPKFFLYAKKHGMLEECLAAQKQAYDERRKAECIASAGNYPNAKEWSKGDSIAYNYAVYRDWIKEIFPKTKKITQ